MASTRTDAEGEGVESRTNFMLPEASSIYLWKMSSSVSPRPINEHLPRFEFSLLLMCG
jgi:hypothetical protein